jgi:hypothetical protein
MKLINLLITCIFLLVIAYAVCGCDEEPAKAKELIHQQEIKITCTMSGCDGTCIVCRPPEPNEPLIEIPSIDPEVKELTLGLIKSIIEDFYEMGYTLDSEAAEKGIIKFIEPNEPECKHENIGKAGLQSACAVYHSDGSICWVCPDCGEYVNSNDNTMLYYTPEPTKGHALDFIPTWPQYIELEKDLVIDSPDSTPDDPIINDAFIMTLSKGTKIYYED